MTHRSPKSPPALGQVARRSARLGALVGHALRLGDLTDCLRAHLDPEIGMHCQVAGLGGGRLTLVADSPVWRTRIRYLTPVIQSLMQEHCGHRVTGVRILAAPPGARPRRPPPRRARAPSAENAKSLLACAETVADPRLGSALRRLARRAGRTP